MGNITCFAANSNLDFREDELLTGFFLSYGFLSQEHIKTNCIIYTPKYESKSKRFSITEIKEQSADMIHHTSETQ